MDSPKLMFPKRRLCAISPSKQSRNGPCLRGGKLDVMGKAGALFEVEHPGRELEFKGR
jgi:hypothetical protein